MDSIGLRSRRGSCNCFKTKSGRRGSNPRRPAWEAGILPLNYSRLRANQLFTLNGCTYLHAILSTVSMLSMDSTCSDEKMDSKKDSMQPENLPIELRFSWVTDSKWTACVVIAGEYSTSGTPALLCVSTLYDDCVLMSLAGRTMKMCNETRLYKLLFPKMPSVLKSLNLAS
jgi:hypothetical protein